MKRKVKHKKKIKVSRRSPFQASDVIARKRAKPIGLDTQNSKGADILKMLDTLDKSAMPLTVNNTVTGEQALVPAIRLQNLADMLKTTYQTVWRWSSETKQLPKPILIDITSGRDYPVYHVEEARVILRVIGNHLLHFAYFRKDHAGAIKDVFDQIDVLRATNYHQTGVNQHGDQEAGKSNRSKGRTRRGKRG